MNTTYAQRQNTAQKTDAPSASSVLDASSQSKSLQRKADMANGSAQRVETPRPNNTGMPDNLKAGIESLSGFSMDDVRVHYNSPKPATVQALAYTQGTDIHVAPGQEKHLPHEAWHVAQQMAGRVSPTTNINGMPVNDNAALEYEADVMGKKAETFENSLEKNDTILQEKTKISYPFVSNKKINYSSQPIQCLRNSVGAYQTYCNYMGIVAHQQPMNFLAFCRLYLGRRTVFPTFQRVNPPIWYRGFSRFHYAYQEFRNSGILASEGPYNDVNWTMGNGGRLTRWLPGTAFLNTALGIAVAGRNFNPAQYDQVRRNNGILGIVVEIQNPVDAYAANGNLSEVQMRGPLRFDQFSAVYGVDANLNMVQINALNNLP